MAVMVQVLLLSMLQGGPRLHTGGQGANRGQACGPHTRRRHDLAAGG